jgi:hypothetical protein
MRNRVRSALRALWRDTSGQSMIEAAIVTPLLVLVTLAILEFGYLLFVNLSLENGVAQAARFGITGNVVEGLSRQDSIKSVMRSSTPTLTIPDGSFQFSHLQGGSWIAGLGGPGTVGKVAIVYTHSVLVLRPLFGGATVTLRVESTMKNESRFQ